MQFGSVTAGGSGEFFFSRFHAKFFRWSGVAVLFRRFFSFELFQSIQDGTHVRFSTTRPILTICPDRCQPLAQFLEAPDRPPYRYGLTY